MNDLRLYTLDGAVLEIPLIHDEQSGKIIEDYREFIENQRFTPGGAPIMFAGEDACEMAVEATPGGCPDCGCCCFFERASEHTWIGICRCDKRKWIFRQDE